MSGQKQFFQEPAYQKLTSQKQLNIKLNINWTKHTSREKLQKTKKHEIDT